MTLPGVLVHDPSCRPVGGGGRTGALLLSPLLTPHTSTCTYNHFSLLHSYEDLFGITTGTTDTCTPGPTVPEVPHTAWLALGGFAAVGFVLIVRDRRSRRLRA